MGVKICAFWTNEDYRVLSEKLRASLDSFGLDYSIVGYPDKRSWSWHQAVSWKPRFILECLKQHKDHDILYVDADAVCESAPDWGIVANTSFACHLWKRSPLAGQEYLTGTIYARQEPMVHEFVEEWAQATANHANPDTPEQNSLAALLGWGHKENGWQKRLRFRSLPPGWCLIFDDMRRMYPDVQAVFTHYQASRSLRFKKREEEAPSIGRQDQSEW